MPVEDKDKNRGYVAKYRNNVKKNEETKKEYNEVNASYVKKHRNIVKETMGVDNFKKMNAEYMRKRRAELKQLKEGNKNNSATILQNALRNRIARKEVLNRKQLKANEIISNINKQKKENDVNQLVQKLNAITFSNDIMNNIFPTVVNAIPNKRKKGRPVGSKNKPKMI